MLAAFGLVGLAGLAGCAPLPPEPVVGGPVHGKEAVGQMATRELVWVSPGGTLRITNSRMCKHEEDATNSASCVKLSASDRRELDRFFGAENFRKRWDAYVPCPQLRLGDPGPTAAQSEYVTVTFADGASITKSLDGQLGNPRVAHCDRSTRNAISGIGDDLVKRYFR